MMEPLVIDSDTFEPISILEEYQKAEWADRYYGDGYFKITMPDYIHTLRNIRKGHLLLIDGLIYRIAQVERTLDKEGAGVVSLGGKNFSLMADRLCLPPAGLDHDTQTDQPAETAIKHYVDGNLGPGASAARQLPGLTIEADQGRGTLVTTEIRYKQLLEVVSEIGLVAGMGWLLTFDFDTSTFVFDVRIGTDRSAEVFFDVEFDTALDTNMLSSDTGATFAYVGGPGEGAARTIVERFLDVAEPTGADRREIFVDAKDAETAGALETTGDAKLTESQPEDIFELEVNPEGSFRLDEHWFVGDLATIRNKVWEVSKTARVVGVVKTSSGGATPDVKVEIDQPWPTIKSKLVQEVNKPTSGDLI